MACTKTSWVKANWDATLNKYFQKMGTSIIIRDSRGEVLACQAFSLDFNLEPMMAKCDTLWRNLFLCDELGLDKVSLDGDAKDLIDAILGTEECCFWYGTRIEDIKHFLQQCLSWSIGFIHREGNQVAYLLVKYSLSVTKEIVWVEDYPNVINYAIIAEQVIIVLAMWWVVEREFFFFNKE